MGIYLETLAINVEAAYIHEQTPEFSRVPPNDILIIEEGKIVIGGIGNRFRSEGLDRCSGIALKDPFDQRFGFFHIYPGQELTSDDVATLTPLADGSACLIQGSNSTEKHRIFRFLFDTLGIVHTDTIPVDTCDTNGKSLPFHAAYRPAANQVLVARISHKDVLTFPAFKF